MPSLGATQLSIILVIGMLVFGARKLTDVGKWLGQGIREFRQSVQDEPQPAAPPPPPAAPARTVPASSARAGAAPVSTAPSASAGPVAATTTATKCTKCGADVQADARFCPACGQPVPS